MNLMLVTLRRSIHGSTQLTKKEKFMDYLIEIGKENMK